MARTGPWPRGRMGQGRGVQALGGLVTTKLKRRKERKDRVVKDKKVKKEKEKQINQSELTHWKRL